MDAVDDFNGLVQDYLAGVDNLDEIVEALANDERSRQLGESSGPR